MINEQRLYSKVTLESGEVNAFTQSYSNIAATAKERRLIEKALADDSGKTGVQYKLQWTSEPSSIGELF